MSAWLSTESPPRDGTKVLAWHRQYGAMTAFRRDGHIWTGAFAYHASAIPSEWLPNFTHWMPIPDRPAQSEAAA